MTAFALLVVALAGTAPAMPEGAALRTSIASRDAEFFELFFLGCDPKRLRPMLTDYAKNCAERAKPGAWRSRRELITSSLTMDPVPGYGAMEAGDHLFYERKGDGAENLAGRSRFAMVWKWEGGTWKLSRILSYAHSVVGK